MKDKQIIDINQSSETNFKRILNATKDTLNEAITSLFNLSAFESTESPICYLKYDYNSLYTTIVYSLLNIKKELSHRDTAPFNQLDYLIVFIQPSASLGHSAMRSSIMLGEAAVVSLARAIP